MAKKPNLIEVLVERHFGPAFEAQTKIETEILKCTSVADFEKMKVDFNSEAAQGVFAAASFDDPEIKKFNAERLNQIYDKLKPVRAAGGFF